MECPLINRHDPHLNNNKQPLHLEFFNSQGTKFCHMISHKIVSSCCISFILRSVLLSHEFYVQLNQSCSICFCQVPFDRNFKTACRRFIHCITYCSEYAFYQEKRLFLVLLSAEVSSFLRLLALQILAKILLCYCKLFILFDVSDEM